MFYVPDFTTRHRIVRVSGGNKSPSGSPNPNISSVHSPSTLVGPSSPGSPHKDHISVDNYVERDPRTSSRDESVLFRIRTAESKCTITLRIHYEYERIVSVFWSLVITLDGENSRTAVMLEKPLRPCYKLNKMLDEGTFSMRFQQANSMREDEDNHLYIIGNLREWGLQQVRLYGMPFEQFLQYMNGFMRAYHPCEWRQF